MRRKLSVAHLTAIDLAPPALIDAAAEAGFDAVGLRLLRVTEDTPGYPLMSDAQAMRATQDALRRSGISVSDIEFVKITPDTDIEALLPLLDAGAALGAKHLITAPYDNDLSRLADRLGAVSEASQARGITTVLEFFPWTCVPDLSTCWKIVQAAGAHVGLLVDALHFDRSNSSLDLLRTIPAHRLPFAHLCDAPKLPNYSTEQLLRTARAERLSPGEGQIDLAAFVLALPLETPLGLEVPTPDIAGAETPVEKLARIRQATERLMQQIADRST